MYIFFWELIEVILLLQIIYSYHRINYILFIIIQIIGSKTYKPYIIYRRKYSYNNFIPPYNIPKFKKIKKNYYYYLNHT